MGRNQQVISDTTFFRHVSRMSGIITGIAVFYLAFGRGWLFYMIIYSLYSTCLLLPVILFPIYLSMRLAEQMARLLLRIHPHTGWHYIVLLLASGLVGLFSAGIGLHLPYVGMLLMRSFLSGGEIRSDELLDMIPTVYIVGSVIGMCVMSYILWLYRRTFKMKIGSNLWE